jgi:RHS repeat-associated protein
MHQTYNGINLQYAVQFLPFGEVRWGYFNAKELDEENGMYYYSARYYAPPTFISRDPMFEKYPDISPYTYCSNNPMNKVDPTGMFDDWVESASGEIYWDKNATSKGTTKPGETYLGKEGYGINSETGGRIHYKSDGTKSESSNELKGPTIKATASEHAKAMQAKRALGMHEFSNTQYGLAPDMIGIQFGAEVFDGVGGGIDITLGYMKGEGGFINIAPKYGLGVDKGSFSAGITTGYYHGKGSPSSASLAGASLFQNISVGMVNISTSIDITDGRIGKNWRTSTIGITNPSIISGSTGISITTPPILKFGGK